MPDPAEITGFPDLGMKAAKAGVIVTRLLRSKTKKEIGGWLKELRALYPNIRFSFTLPDGLHVALPPGGARIPTIIRYSATRIVELDAQGRETVIKSREPIVGLSWWKRLRNTQI